MRFVQLVVLGAGVLVQKEVGAGERGRRKKKLALNFRIACLLSLAWLFS
jgi:hypothetical protein